MMLSMCASVPDNEAASAALTPRAAEERARADARERGGRLILATCYGVSMAEAYGDPEDLALLLDDLSILGAVAGRPTPLMRTPSAANSPTT